MTETKTTLAPDVCPGCYHQKSICKCPPASETGPELVPLTQVRDMEVWVRIKKTSKYFHQGLSDPTDPKSKACFFKLEMFTPRPDLSLMLDSYSIRFNGNSYRIEDVEIFLRDAKNPKLFLRIR